MTGRLFPPSKPPLFSGLLRLPDSLLDPFFSAHTQIDWIPTAPCDGGVFSCSTRYVSRRWQTCSSALWTGIGADHDRRRVPRDPQRGSLPDQHPQRYAAILHAGGGSCLALLQSAPTCNGIDGRTLESQRRIDSVQVRSREEAVTCFPPMERLPFSRLLRWTLLVRQLGWRVKREPRGIIAP